MPLFKTAFTTHPTLLRTVPILFFAGLLSALAFAPFFCFPILIITLSFFMWVLNHAQKAKRAALFGFAFGAGLGVSSLGWVCNALMIDNGSFAVFIPVCLIGLALFLGFFWMLSAWVAFYAPSGIKRWIAFACSVVFFEWVRSWFLTGFPWNLIGSVWTDNLYFLQFASVWGVYGLTFVTVMIFTATGLLPNKKPLVFALILASVITAGGWLRLYQATPEDVFGVNLRIVQPNIQQTLKWNPQKAEDNLNTLIRLSKTKNEEITHVIWPESAIPYLLENNPTERLRLMSAIRQGGTLITGALRIVSREKRQLANSIFMIDHLANIVGYADKAHLVPFGEYIPFRNILPLDKVVPIQSDFVAGKKVKTIMVPKAVPAALLVCYEIIFSGRVTDKNNHPQWIVNVTNDGWYGISPGPFQHLGMAQLRAVEEGLPVVRAANTGISALISPYGEILSYKALNTQGVIDTKLPRATEPTIYSQFGYKPFIVFVVLIYLIMIWHSLINIGKRRTNHKKENTKNQKST